MDAGTAGSGRTLAINRFLQRFVYGLINNGEQNMSKASANLVVAIKAANKVLSAAFASGDMKKTAACYTKNARLLAPNTPACNGQAAIARFWSGARDMGIGRVVLRTLEIESHGTTANETGTYTLKTARGANLDKGKYVVVWKSQRGKWKLHWDIFNSNDPS